MKTLWITLCKNEMDILPFVRRYWERINCNVLVYDNGSNDGSVEYLSSIPYVTVKSFESDGHNDIVHKHVKEQAYLENKNDYDIIIITDMDEVFYFEGFENIMDNMVKANINTLITPLYSICEDYMPEYNDKLLLHQLCHKFYKQRMNHMKGFDDYSKISIFNTKITDKVEMSVGQHYVQTYPAMRLAISNNAFGIHFDKGFGVDYYVNKKRKMGENLSETNKKYGMGIEYLNSIEQMKQEYENNQKKSFDINKKG